MYISGPDKTHLLQLPLHSDPLFSVMQLGGEGGAQLGGSRVYFLLKTGKEQEVHRGKRIQHTPS